MAVAPRPAAGARGSVEGVGVIGGSCPLRGRLLVARVGTVGVGWVRMVRPSAAAAYWARSITTSRPWSPWSAPRSPPVAGRDAGARPRRGRPRSVDGVPCLGGAAVLNAARAASVSAVTCPRRGPWPWTAPAPGRGELVAGDHGRDVFGRPGCPDGQRRADCRASRPEFAYVLPCEHEQWGAFAQVSGQRPPALRAPPPPDSVEPPAWGVSASRPGDLQMSAITTLAAQARTQDSRAAVGPKQAITVGPNGAPR